MDRLNERDPSKANTEQGLYRKFDVRRTDGTDEPGGKHHGCDYFVLDVTHDPLAKAALSAYAASVEATHPQLAADMRERYAIEALASEQGEAVAWIEPKYLAMLEKCRNDYYPGTVKVWTREHASATVPLYTATPPAQVSDAEKFCDGHCTWLDHRPDCLQAAQASEPPQGGDVGRLVGAYGLGWAECARWAERDDLAFDTGSKAYTEARDRLLASLIAREQKP